MKTIKLNGSKWKVRSTPAGVKRILANYEVTKMHEWNDEVKAVQFIIDMAWEFLKPKFGLKPFITKKRFEELVNLDDLRKNNDIFFSELYGIEPEEIEKQMDDEQGDRDSGNVTPLTGTNG